MIDVINKAIEAKLKSYAFTGVVNGLVESLEPLKIKINDRIVIGLEFIEPKSLGITDNSPTPTLPFIVGDKINLIRYNNGQRFYVLGKVITKIGKLNTNNTQTLTAGEEEFTNDISLHKISKTGSYNDLLNKPTIPAAQIQSDWNQADNSKLDYVKNKIVKATGAEINTGTDDNKYVTSKAINDSNIVVASDILNLVYPIGAIYLSVVSTSPATLFGGTWQAITGYYLYAGTGGNTAGSNTSGSTAITEAQLPAHGHGMAHGHNGLKFHLGAYTGAGGNAWQLDSTTDGSSASLGGNSTKTITDSAGSGQGHTHTVAPLRYEVYMWKRTA